MIVLVEEHHDLPLALLHVGVGTGPASDGPGLEGRCRHAFELMRRGAGTRDREALDLAFDALGATVDLHATHDSIALEVRCLAKNLGAVTDLVADVLARPHLAADEHEHLQREGLASLDEMRDDDPSLCSRYFDRAALPGHAYGRSGLGTAASIAALSRAQAAAWVTENVVRDNLVIGLAGAVSADEARAYAERCVAGLPRRPAPPRLALAAPSVGGKGRRTVLIDKPERAQSQIIIGHAGPPATHPDLPALRVAATAFGGLFTSRLMTEVRVKRGWSYGASFNTGRTRSGHTFKMRVFPSAEQTPDTLALVLGLWDEVVRDGLRDDEIDLAKSYLEGSWAFEIDTPSARLDRRLEALTWGLPEDAVAKHVETLRALTPAAVNAALRAHWRPDQAVIAVTCTAEGMRARLDGLALGEIEVVGFEEY